MKHRKHKKHASPVKRFGQEAEARVVELYRTHSGRQTARLTGTRVSHIASIIRRHRREVGYFHKNRTAVHPDIPVNIVIPYDKLGHGGGSPVGSRTTGSHAHPEHVTSTNVLETVFRDAVEVERPLWGGSHITQNRLALDTTLALLSHAIGECSLKLENFDAEFETLTEMWEKAVEASREVLDHHNSLVIARTEVEVLIEEAK